MAFTLTERRATCLVLTASAVLHLAAFLSLPLMVTPDGQRYLAQAAHYLGAPLPAGTLQWNVPGFPLLLAATTGVFGVTPPAILLVQHLIGVATVWLVVRSACALAGPWVGLGIGLVAAAEPWALAWTTYVLTEPLAAALLAGAMALIIRLGRTVAGAGVVPAGAVGLLAATAYLTRPAAALLAPFLAAAVLAAAWRTRRRLLPGALALAAGLAAPLALDRALNPVRGRLNAIENAGVMFFWGAGMFGMPDPAYITSPDLRAVYDRTVGDETNPIRDDRLVRFWREARAFESPAAARFLGRWAAHEVARQPGTYAVNAWHTTLWLLNAGVRDRPPMYNELTWLTARIFLDGRQFGQNASNFQGANFGFPGARGLALGYPGGGVLKPYLSWWARIERSGFPHVPLALAALAATILCVRRRRWDLAAAVAGSLAFVTAHALLLTAATRFTSTILPVWYIAVAVLVAELRRRPAPVGQAGPTRAAL